MLRYVWLSAMPVLLVFQASPALSQTPNHGTGPKRVDGARGYNHPNQYLVKQAVQLADNMEPVMVHQDQDAAARQKLAELKKKFGKTPNILIFLTDDTGWLDYGFNGGGESVGNPTPDLDRVASQGLILTSAYSTPTCSPTRATILTGQHPVHHGILVPPMYGMPGGMQGLPSLPKFMSAQGYVTQAIGKWHIGENEGSQPQNVGFDDFRGFLSVSDMYTEWRDPDFNPEVALSPDRYAFMQKLPFNKNDVHAVRGGKLENVGEITIDYIKDLDQRWCRYGEEFIRKQQGAAKPFFLYYCTRGAHFDNYPNEKYAGISPARTTYSDTIVEINDIFQRLHKALEESGELENTLIIFSSDNGPEEEVVPCGRTTFRGGKGSTWEGGMRVPTFAYWKGVIRPRKSDGLFYLGDLFNTSLSLAGKHGAEIGKLVGSKEYVDGVDQASFLLAENGQSNRRSMLYFLNDELSAVRMDEFKYMILAQVADAFTKKGNIGGLSGSAQRPAASLMFNLYTDPQETDHIGIRHIPMGVPLLTEIDRYQAVLKKYPKRKQVGLP